MKINNEVIEEYTDYLACNHDSIIEEINSSSSRISRELSYQVCSFLEDLKHSMPNSIVLPSEDDIKNKILETIKSSYFDSIEGIENFIRKQNNALDYCVQKKDEETLEVDANNLLPIFKNNNDELKDEEKIQNPASQVTNQIITHINFRNINNEEYRHSESLVEKKVTDIVSVKFTKENAEFDEINELHKERLSRKTYDLSNYILEEQKNQIAYGESLEEVSKHTK